MSVHVPQTSSPNLDDPETLARVQHDYAAALPRIEAHAKVYFRHLRTPERREEAIANVVGIGWKLWLSAVRHGKDPSAFVSSIADKAVRQVRSGRRVDGTEAASDVMSPRAQMTKGFTVASLPDHTDAGADNNATVDALRDNRCSSPPDQAAFRTDIPEWLARLTEKKRSVVTGLMNGDTTAEAAAKHRLSAGRISQIRREAYDELSGDAEGRSR